MAKWERYNYFGLPVERREAMESSNGQEYITLTEIRLPADKVAGRYPSRPVPIRRDYFKVGDSVPYATQEYPVPGWMKKEAAYRDRLRNLKAVHKRAAEFTPTMGEALAAAMSK